MLHSHLHPHQLYYSNPMTVLHAASVSQQSRATVSAKWATAGNIGGLSPDRQFSPQWDNGSGWSGCGGGQV